MDRPKVLLLDLKIHKRTSGIFPELASFCSIRVVCDAVSIPGAIRRFCPDFLLFEYDYPEHSGLAALRRTKQDFPQLPILMVTQYHSEALAIWALRSRVWDYLIMPESREDLIERATKLLTQTETGEYKDSSGVNLLPAKIPTELLAAKALRKAFITNPAACYVNAHWAEKITLKKMAELCGMNLHDFSRSFHREHGLTFREFLLQYRIGKALKLLSHPGIAVTDVALAVGFLDLSNFCRTFRKYVGVSPTRYRFAMRTSRSAMEAVLHCGVVQQKTKAGKLKNTYGRRS